MKNGDQIKISAVVLRVEGSRLHAQTADGQLIITDVSNVMENPSSHEKQQNLPEHKAIRHAPETKPIKKPENKDNSRKKK